MTGVSVFILSLRKSSTFHYTARRTGLLRWKNSLKNRESTKRSCESGRRRSLIRKAGISQIRGGERFGRGRRGRGGGAGFKNFCLLRGGRAGGGGWGVCPRGGGGQRRGAGRGVLA